MGTIKDTIAKNIRFYRKKLNLSQKTLGKMVGVNNTAISNWENGNNSIDIETLFKVCSALGISIETVSNNEDNFYLDDAEVDFIKRYRQLGDHGKYIINALLEIELKSLVDTELIPCNRSIEDIHNTLTSIEINTGAK